MLEQQADVVNRLPGRRESSRARDLVTDDKRSHMVGGLLDLMLLQRHISAPSQTVGKRTQRDPQR
ncbi:hypothetical protein A9K71_12935 [Mesorhizobium sp. WSM3873]|nr:hypothetical protein A9K71_12935 [Mesorhizobium sp. WSM3873]